MKILVLGLLSGLALSAGPLYTIQFSGTIDSGSASAYNPVLNAFGATEFADLTGRKISGTLTYDLGVAPSPVVTPIGGGAIDTTIQTPGSPAWISQSIVIDGLTAPGGFVPLPAIFNQPLVLALPGSTTTLTPPEFQTLRFSGRPDGTAQAIFAMFAVNSASFGPRFNGNATNSVFLAVLDSLGFFTPPPSGDLPGAWSLSPTSTASGSFNFFIYSTDLTVPENFGIVQTYQLRGTFSADSVTGGFADVPEPATLSSAAAALLAAAFALRRRAHSARL